MLGKDALHDEDRSQAPALLEACERLTDVASSSGAADRLRSWASGCIPLVDTEALVRFAGDASADELIDEFSRLLPFGTGGRRGHVGFGSNRINPTLLALTVQGHDAYLRERFPSVSRKVVIAFDVREFNDLAGRYSSVVDNPLDGLSSRRLAELAARIYAANGTTVVMPSVGSEVCGLTTPELSFAIRDVKAQGGLMISASHNHPDDNGFKVYNHQGAQPIEPEDQFLTDAMVGVTEVRLMKLQEALESGSVVDQGGELRERYQEMYAALSNGISMDRAQLVYTPLCGSGGESVGAVLRRIGHEVHVPPNQGPDGTFAAIPFRSPNPEVPEALEPSRRFADARGIGIVLSSDPDADRLGLDVRDDERGWVHFTGNQIATIVGYYLMLDDAGPKQSGLVVATSVTTRSLGRIAELRGGSSFVGDLPVGFKYVGAVLGDLEEHGRYEDLTGAPGDLVLAAEESYGFLVTPEVRDKDATSPAIHLAALQARLSRESKTLVDYYESIVAHIGAFAEKNRSLVLLGESGARDIAGLMGSLRTDPPNSLAGQEVAEVHDYLDEAAFGPIISDTQQRSRNVVAFTTARFTATIRPSNTEPKVKLYLQAAPLFASPAQSGAELNATASRQAQDLADAVLATLLKRLDLALSAPTLALPDLISVPLKIEFERQILPELRRRLLDDPLDIADIEAWLASSCAPMTPGANPLAAIMPAVQKVMDEHGSRMSTDARSTATRWLSESLR